MKKLKIIVVNLILFLIFFHIADFYCSIIDTKYNWCYKKYNGIKLIKYIKDYNLIHYYNTKFDEDNAKDLLLVDWYCNSSDDLLTCGGFRPIENKNVKNAILIFGCSYAYGQTLNNQETFSYHLGKILPNYAIYNRAQSGWSTSHMLYQLENKDFSNVKNLKYVMYVFIPDHYMRNSNSATYTSRLRPTPYYKNGKYGILKFQKNTFKNMVCPLLVQKRQLFRNKMFDSLYNENDKNQKRMFELTKNIILYSKDMLDYDHNGTKFIILRYDRGKLEPYDDMFEELKREGIIVLSINDLSKTDYNTVPYQLSETDYHPNAKAWNEITPQFVKYMQDRGYLKD